MMTLQAQEALLDDSAITDSETSDGKPKISHATPDDRDPTSGSDDSSDSDSLDSTGSRKRRRLSVPLEEDDDEDGPLPQITTFAPSRIKAKTQSNGVQLASVKTNGSITAPVHTDTTFESLKVKPWLVKSLTAMAIKRPTGIQKGCIPEILNGRDCIGGSRTGSGKTVAFAVPIIQKWAEDPFGIFALVLTPTR